MLVKKILVATSAISLLSGCDTFSTLTGKDIPPPSHTVLYGNSKADKSDILDAQLGIAKDQSIMTVPITLQEIRSKAGSCYKASLPSETPLATGAPWNGVDCKPLYAAFYEIAANASDLSCEIYLNEIGRLQTDYKQAGDMVNSAGTGAAALAALLSAGSIITGAIGVGLGLLNSFINTTAQNYLYDVEAGQIKALVKDKAISLRGAHLAGFSSYPEAEQAVFDYFVVCTPETIRKYIGDAIADKTRGFRSPYSNSNSGQTALGEAYLFRLQNDIGRHLRQGQPLTRQELMALYTTTYSRLGSDPRAQAEQVLTAAGIRTAAGSYALRTPTAEEIAKEAGDTARATQKIEKRFKGDMDAMIFAADTLEEQAAKLLTAPKTDEPPATPVPTPVAPAATQNPATL